MDATAICASGNNGQVHQLEADWSGSHIGLDAASNGIDRAVRFDAMLDVIMLLVGTSFSGSEIITLVISLYFYCRGR